MAGTVRVMWRSMTPVWSLVLPWLPPLSPATLAQRQPNDEGQLSATKGCPGPPGQQRAALAPSCSGVPPASICATRPSERRGSGVRQERQTSVVRSEKCMACWGNPWDGMRVITACFAYLLQRCASRMFARFLLILHEVGKVDKTCNQLTDKAF